jgi:4-aminobutyrate aminotransferase-like enzyme
MWFYPFNNEADLAKITTRTAGNVLETIQGGAGFIQPHNDFWKVRARCTEVGALWFRWNSTGFWKNGKNFWFQNYDVVPDVVVLWEKNGWRNASGRFTASTEMMDLLSDNPKTGTSPLWGHPVIASAC